MEPQSLLEDNSNLQPDVPTSTSGICISSPVSNDEPVVSPEQRDLLGIVPEETTSLHLTLFYDLQKEPDVPEESSQSSHEDALDIQ